MPHRNDGNADGHVVFVLRNLADKTLVDFQHVDRKPLELRQRRIPGAKVIDRHPHAQSAQALEHLPRLFGALGQCTFGDLQLQQPGRKPRIGQGRRGAARQVGQVELARRHVHSQRQIGQAGPAPLFSLAADLAQYPFAQRADHARGLGHGDKPRGRDEPLDRVVPAHQRLSAHDAARGDIDLGLVVHHHVALGQRQAQARLQLQPLARSLRHGFMKKAPRAPPARLGAIHRRVCALQQPVGGRGMLGKHANAHADTSHHLQPLGGLPRLGHRRNQMARHQRGAVGMAQVAHHHGQFVARHAPQQVAGPQRPLHLLRDVLQHGIARGVAIAVVHVLEAVQVQDQHGQYFTAALGLLHGYLQLLHKPRAVEQPRERVVVREVFQTLALRLVL